MARNTASNRLSASQTRARTQSRCGVAIIVAALCAVGCMGGVFATVSGPIFPYVAFSVGALASVLVALYAFCRGSVA